MAVYTPAATPTSEHHTTRLPAAGAAPVVADVTGPLGPAHDVFASLAALVPSIAEAPVGLVVLGDSDLVRLRTAPDSRLAVPLHGTTRLRDVLRHVVARTTRLRVVDVRDLEWPTSVDHPELCGIASIAVAPVVHGGRVVGVVGAADTMSRPWSPQELARLADVARVVEHELNGRATVAVADALVSGWDVVAETLDATTYAVATLVREAHDTEDPALRARGALVRGRVEALTQDVLRLEGLLAPGRDAVSVLAPADLRWGVTAAVRAVARAHPEVRLRPRLHGAALPALGEPEAVRAGVLALLHAVTLTPGDGEIVVALELVPGSPDDAARGPVARLRVEAPGRACDVAVLAGAVGRFEALVRRAASNAGREPCAVDVTGDEVRIEGRDLMASTDPTGTRVETTWRIDVG